MFRNSWKFESYEFSGLKKKTEFTKQLNKSVYFYLGQLIKYIGSYDRQYLISISINYNGYNMD
jgi:hypothetical protein